MSNVWVAGPPGTGKTTELSRLARRAAMEKGPHSVIIASLTRAAATEIGGRDTGIPEDNCATFHAHCYRALDRPELAETPEGIRSWNEHHPQAALSRGTNQLEDSLGDTGGQAQGDDLHHQVMTNRARMLPRSQWTVGQLEHDALWTDYKTQTGRLDFTDLIERAIAEVPDHPAHPRVMLLDEAQDFSRLELELATRWAARTQTTVMVGDPDQAIYQWRGADPQALADLQLAGERTLDQSYRIPHSVHSLATSWIDQIENRRYARYAPTSVQGQVGRQNGVSLNSPETLVMQALCDLQAGDGDVMILASCRYMLAPLLAVLRKQGVPFHNPYRANDGSWNPMRAANRLKAFLRPDQRVWGDGARNWTWDDLRLFCDPLQAKGNLARGAKTLIESKCQRDRFGESRADETVPLETLENIFGAAPPHHPAYRLDVDWYYEQLRAEGRKTLAYPVEVLRQHGHQALRDQPRLIVGSGHSVKGGEARKVYIAPDLSVAGFHGGWRAGGLGRGQIVRLFYVMMTRAREHVTILDPAAGEHIHTELVGCLEQQEAIAA
jgi:DNA helicase-2/ATP-dependent DNA helicase PcrA